MLTKIPNGLDEILHIFGDCHAADFERKNIVLIEFPYPLLYEGKPVTHGRCHRLALDNFVAALTNVKTRGLTAQLKNYSGIYQQRSIRGLSHHPSAHSWGIAGDFEAAKFPLGSKKRMSPEIIKCFQDAGFFYGGDFKARSDSQHYQLCKNY